MPREPKRPFKYNPTVENVKSLLSVNQTHVLVRKFTKIPKQRAPKKVKIKKTPRKKRIKTIKIRIKIDQIKKTRGKSNSLNLVKVK